MATRKGMILIDFSSLDRNGLKKFYELLLLKNNIETKKENNFLLNSDRDVHLFFGKHKKSEFLKCVNENNNKILNNNTYNILPNSNINNIDNKDHYLYLDIVDKIIEEISKKIEKNNLYIYVFEEEILNLLKGRCIPHFCFSGLNIKEGWINYFDKDKFQKDNDWLKNKKFEFFWFIDKEVINAYELEKNQKTKFNETHIFGTRIDFPICISNHEVFSDLGIEETQEFIESLHKDFKNKLYNHELKMLSNKYLEYEILIEEAKKNEILKFNIENQNLIFSKNVLLLGIFGDYLLKEKIEKIYSMSEIELTVNNLCRDCIFKTSCHEKGVGYWVKKIKKKCFGARLMKKF